MVDLNKLGSLPTKVLSDRLTATLSKLHRAMVSKPCNPVSEDAKISPKALDKLKLQKLQNDLEVILERLESFGLTNMIFLYSEVLLLRVIQQMKSLEPSSSSRTTLKYFFLASVLISCKMILEDKKHTADQIANMFKYESQRLIRVEKLIIIEMLKFQLNVGEDELVLILKDLEKEPVLMIQNNRPNLELL